MSPVPVYHLDEAFLPIVFDLSLSSKEEEGGDRSFVAEEEGFETVPPPQLIPIVPKPSQVCSCAVDVDGGGLEGTVVSDGVDLWVLVGSGGRRETSRRRREGGNEEEEETWWIEDRERRIEGEEEC